MQSPQGDRVLLLYNRSAGQRHAAARIDELTSALGTISLEVTRCDSLAELTDYIDAGDRDWRAVICAGGDGTANAALNVVGNRAPLIPFPLGNENLLAKHLGISADAEVILRLLESGVLVEYDVAARDGRRFLLMLSCGFDADVVKRVHRNRTSHVNKLTYLKQVARAVQRYQFPPIRTELVDERGEHQTLEGHWVFVFNVASYARGLDIAPMADPCDGLLDVCVFQGSSILTNVGHFATVLLGIHGRWSGCQHVRATRAQISSEVPIPIQADGDPSGQTSADVHIVPRGVQLIVPQNAA